MPRLTGNKGEWSEFYAFVKLLSTGVLYAADENVNRLENTYFPILKILREENQGGEKEYVISSEDGSVEVHWHTDTIRNLTRAELVHMASGILTAIQNGGNRAFEIDGSERMMDALACSKISAPSTDKTDITLQVHDIYTGYDSICGFSIKSELGSAPTLLNASGATNFVFEVPDISDAEAERINAINTPTKIIDRMNAIRCHGALKFVGAANSVFAVNLMFIDTGMERIIGEVLLDYYCNNIAECKALTMRLEQANPLSYPGYGLYEYKFKNFLCAVALGMMPASGWNGQDEANGGYVIVKQNGDVVAYHLYNRDAFKSYLLNNTKLERGSTTRHNFATIYTGTDGKKYINLNLQIRFV